MQSRSPILCSRFAMSSTYEMARNQRRSTLIISKLAAIEKKLQIARGYYCVDSTESLILLPSSPIRVVDSIHM